jgi:cytochrome c553
LETPRQYFDRAFTPNPACYVRYHLELIPYSVDLGTWRLQLEGNFDKPMQLSFEDLVRSFPAVSIDAVAQYYATVHATTVPPPARSPDLVKRGEALAAAGDMARQVLPCTACHGQKGFGEPPVTPYLAGQYGQ